MKIRKFIVPLVMVAIMLPFLGLQSATAIVATNFSDVEGYQPAYKAINFLKDAGTVVGYSDGTFGVDKNINRAEFLKIAMSTSSYTPTGSDCFPDVKKEWFAPYICEAKKQGLVSGYPDGYFRPEKEINFAESSKILVNTWQVDKSENEATWFAPYVLALEDKKAIPAEMKNFDQKLTRSQMAEMAWRVEEDRTYKISNTYENIAAGVAIDELSSSLASFSSCTQLKNYIEDNTSQSGGIYYGIDDMVKGEIAPTTAPSSESTTGADTMTAPTDSSSGANEYSSTNVQVAGVDEADIVKNDNKYVYSLKDNTVRIIDAYPPSGMKELSKVTFGDSNFYPSDMYVDGNKLVVIGSSYSEQLYDPGLDVPGVRTMMPLFRSSSMTKVYIVDITDRANASIARELSFDGDYSTSRKVDGIVYLVANQYNYSQPWVGDNWKEGDILPLYADSKTGVTEPIVSCADVRYMPAVIDSTNYLILAALDINNLNSDLSTQVVLGSTGTVFASPDNLYVAEPRYRYSSWYQESGDREETYVHKFSLDGTNVEYKGLGKVPGTVLNQFSMDEYNGYFRVATTLQQDWQSGASSENNVYALDSNLNLVGKLEGLAQGEQIYSVRFIGDRAYMVTFKRIDPLFVIDMSVPANPTLLGQLKIPGVSDYLHPYDENHLIGFGLETLNEAETEVAGFTWFQGIKVSMFDVTDVTNPVELHKVVIGDRGTSSPLQYNHKALLFDKTKGIMAFPITVAEIPQSVKDNLQIANWQYGDSVFQGAYVYNVSIENGFTLRGKITHYADTELGANFRYYYPTDSSKDIQRILYIGDYFYTVSSAKVKASNMTDLIDAGTVNLVK